MARERPDCREVRNFLTALRINTLKHLAFAYRAMAVNVGMMASYDQIKYIIVKARGQDDFMTRVVCAGIAGFACAWTSLPFDRIKTTMQDMTPDKNVSSTYFNILLVFVQTCLCTGQAAVQEHFRLWQAAGCKGRPASNVARVLHVRRALRTTCHDLLVDYGHVCEHLQQSRWAQVMSRPP